MNSESASTLTPIKYRRPAGAAHQPVRLGGLSWQPETLPLPHLSVAAQR